MSIPVKNLIHWLNSLPINASVGVDDGGLTLKSPEAPNAYLEIGGLPEEDTEAI